MKVQELTGPELDLQVARCEGYSAMLDDYGCVIRRENVIDRFDPSSNWGWGGPIIEREFIALVEPNSHGESGFTRWGAHCNAWGASGDTPLIAAMRAYVSLKLGPEIKAP